MNVRARHVKVVAVSTLLTVVPRLAWSAPATPAQQAPLPVAVLWMGEVESDVAQRIVDEVNLALSHRETAKPIDSIEFRHALVDGGPTTKAMRETRAGEAALARGKLAEAATEFEKAEATLLNEVPFESLRAHLGEVERGLLSVYDQLGRNDDATRAATRLRMTPGSVDDVKVLLDRHSASTGYGASLPPVLVGSQPPGAQVYRNLLPVGVTPFSVDGGDRTIDFVDIEAPGSRRTHLQLGMGGEVAVTLVGDERIGVAVDRIRDASPDAPPSEVADLGKRVGAKRVLALLPDGPRKVLARWLDVDKGTWTDASLRVDNAGNVAMERLAGYADPRGNADGAGVAGLAPAPAPQAPPPPKKKLGMWGKWYTWVAAGGVAALVIGLLVAQNVGDDKLVVKSTR